MEIIPTRIDSSDIKCHGCIRLKKDIMISTVQDVDDPEGNERTKFTNIFLTLDQAREFVKDLDKTIRESETYIEDVLQRTKQGMNPSQIARDTMKPVNGIQRIVDDFGI